jgi:hypothetical protein
LRLRACIQSSSLQAYADSKTRLEVAGGSSAHEAIGSAFSRQSPSAPRMTYL